MEIRVGVQLWCVTTVLQVTGRMVGPGNEAITLYGMYVQLVYGTCVFVCTAVPCDW